MLKTLLNLFIAFFRIGLFTFGGGMAMLPMIESEMVRRGFSRSEIYDYFSLSQTLPGVIAINSATLIGRKAAGIRGAGAATLGVIAPSYIVIVAIIVLFQNYLGYTAVQTVFTGIRAAAAALILKSGFAMLKNAVMVPHHDGRKPQLSFFNIFIFSGVLVLMAQNINPFYLILAAAAAGTIRYLLIRRTERGKEA
jgi:chromate transporter